MSWIKNNNYLSLGLHKGRPSYRRSLQLTQKRHPALQNMKFPDFFYFCASFFYLLDTGPDPDSKNGSGAPHPIIEIGRYR